MSAMDDFHHTIYYIDYDSMDVRSCFLRPGQIESTHYLIKDKAWDALLEKATQDFLLWVNAAKAMDEYCPSGNATNLLRCKARRAKLALDKAVSNCGKDWAKINRKEIDEKNG